MLKKHSLVGDKTEKVGTLNLHLIYKLLSITSTLYCGVVFKEMLVAVVESISALVK